MPEQFASLTSSAAAMAPAMGGADPLAALAPLMHSKGATGSPAEFHQEVHRAFDAWEADYYDEIHGDMWESLPQQLQLLTNDYLWKHAPSTSRLAVLDIGCGTGLSAELLLETRLGPFIHYVDLLDPSPEMLRICTMRKSIRTVRHRMIQGTLDQLAPRPSYDVIVAGAVLRHIPDLPAFLGDVAIRQKPGGIFVQLHDPNGDYRDDPKRLDRVRQLDRSAAARLARMRRQLDPGKWWSGVRSRLEKGATKTFIGQINEELLRRNITTRKLSAPELWRVVDLHPRKSDGISIHAMKAMLPGYQLVSCRSYAFFGEVLSNLPRRFQDIERSLIEANALNGSRIGAVWMKTIAPNS